MSQADTFSTASTILLRAWYSSTEHETRTMPLEPDDYKMAPSER